MKLIRLGSINLWASLILGLLLGTVLGTQLMAVKVDTLTMDNQRLIGENRDLVDRLTRLEASLQERRRFVVRSIKVIIVKELIGREVLSIDPPLLTSLINGRVINLQGQDYILTLVGSHVTEQVTLYIRLTLGNNQDALAHYTNP